MKIKRFIPVLSLLCLAAFIFSSCSGKFTFKYDSEEIESITIITVNSGGGNKEDIVSMENRNALIEDLNGLNYKSYSGDIRGISKYQIVIKLANGDEEIIDAFRIRRTGNKPLKYQCDEARFKAVAEKYIK